MDFFEPIHIAEKVNDVRIVAEEALGASDANQDGPEDDCCEAPAPRAYFKRARSFVLRKLGLSDTLLREAMVAGLSGGAIIAIWFLIVDSLQGRPLYTPTVLGTALIQRQELASLENLPISLGKVLFYTVVHGVAFCFVGTIAVRLFAAAERHPSVIFGILLFFIFFFSGFLTVAFLFAMPVLQALNVTTIVIGNILATLVIVGYLWRRHPLDLRRLL